MLTYALRLKLPDVAAQVALRFPGCHLHQSGNDAVLTINPDLDNTVRAQVCRFVCAAGYDDFRLSTPDDEVSAPATEEWLAVHRPTSRLDHALTTFR